MNENLPMSVTLCYLDAEGKEETAKLSGASAGYALETTNPGMVRAWGYFEGDGDHCTILVPIERVVLLAYMPA